jgi:hypothetical protein
MLLHGRGGMAGTSHVVENGTATAFVCELMAHYAAHSTLDGFPDAIDVMQRRMSLFGLDDDDAAARHSMSLFGLDDDDAAARHSEAGTHVHNGGDDDDPVEEC